MKIVVINGTEVKGCTYHIKEIFLSVLREENELIEFYLPKDLPYFCCGCKICFSIDETLCPHAEYVMPIWNAILKADLLVFATPVYALRMPGQVKALLDHLCCHWLVHRPEKALFIKRAVILTNSFGVLNRAAQKDIITSLNWLGVSEVKGFGFGLIDGVIWDELSEARRKKIELKVIELSIRYVIHSPGRKGLKVRLFFWMCKILHQRVLKKEGIPSADSRHWLDSGWISL